MSNKPNRRNSSFSKKMPYIPPELDDYGLDVYEYRLVCRICRRCGAGNGCYESIENMSMGCDMSVGTAKRRLKDLVKSGVLSKVSRHGRTDIYHINPPEHWEPRSEVPNVRTTVKNFTDPEMDLTDPGEDLKDLAPRSDVTDEVTNLNSSTKVSTSNNGKVVVGVEKISADLKEQVFSQSEVSESVYGIRGSQDAGEDIDSVLLLLKDAAQLGVNIRDGQLKGAVQKYPQNVSPAISALKERIGKNRVHHPTRFLLKAILEGWKPQHEKNEADERVEFSAWYNAANMRNLVIAAERRPADGRQLVLDKNDNWHLFDDLRLLSLEELSIKLGSE